MLQTTTGTDTLPLLDGEVVGFFADAVTSSLDVRTAAAKIVHDQLRGRAPLEQIVAAALEIMREQATENGQLVVELDRAETELDRRDVAAVS